MRLKKEYEIYGDLLFQHKPTIRTLILHLLYSKFVKRERTKLTVYREAAQFQDPERIPEHIETKYIALVSDGKVKELIRLQKYAADLILSKQTKFIEFDPATTHVKKGMVYKDKKFIDGEINEEN